MMDQLQQDKISVKIKENELKLINFCASLEQPLH